MSTNSTPTRILRQPAVQERLGVASATLWRMIPKGFPKPIRIGSRAIGWVEAEVEGWIAARQAERDATKAHAPDVQIAGAVAKRKPRRSQQAEPATA